MVDPSLNQAIADLGVSLTVMAAKGTATSVATKIKALKQEKNCETIRNAYNEIIDELIQERSEAIGIAQAYKDQLERVQISEEDIDSLDATIGRVLGILTSFPGVFSDNSEKAQEQEQTFNQLRSLISADTLRTMQLLGFNYKAAIGEPLTTICANAILSLDKTSQIVPSKANRSRH